MNKIQILVGTVTGTALGVAEFLERKLPQLTDTSLNVVLNQSPHIKDLSTDSDCLNLFCTSNTGAGELPESLSLLFEELSQTKPDLRGLKFAVINIGDSSYPTFGAAGNTLAGQLQALGAHESFETLLVDSSFERYPQKLALEWSLRFIHDLIK